MTVASPCKIMMVCTGNICRSAMAHVIVADRIAQRGLSEVIEVDSSGVSNEEQGNPIDRRALRVLAEHGYTTDNNHSARQITRRDIASTHVFFAMTASHYRTLQRMIPQERWADIHMYREFDPEAQVEVQDLRQLDLEDPWYGGMHEFEIAYEQIERSADAIIDWIVSTYGLTK